MSILNARFAKQARRLEPTPHPRPHSPEVPTVMIHFYPPNHLCVKTEDYSKDEQQKEYMQGHSNN